ncbi:glutathione S-transferase family protein [Chondromyces apiculatus]|uniref:Glutathione S-transferase n=1 Tax=Chondromyces apiculatus DSM 436 TaxID=1192034 RepID=A0A017SXH3_9BACT|nr:glutathione S-transferase family protein [Chondromyces apiculatus]EYF00996.1 Glutathione S-transferase [Chondromyces apiculatus DSM 436]
MSLVLHDLVFQEDRRPSPFCWRIKMALAHKGLPFQTNPVPFTGIRDLHGGAYPTVPILDDGERTVHDSWAIADDLEARYPERPLFGSPGERGLCRFTEAWLFTAVFPLLLPMYVLDLHDHTLERDRAYFRAKREKMFGHTLEEASAGREKKRDAARASLQPARMTLKKQPFLSGEQAGYADYIVGGALHWVASIGTLPLLEAGDPLVDWFERLRDLHGGAGRTSPTYALVG